MKEQYKKNIKKFLIRGSIISIISLPFTLVILIKAIYYLKEYHKMFVVFSDLMVDLYDNYSFIQFFWDLTPNPNYTAFTFSNFLCLIILAIFIYGLIQISKANSIHDKLRKARIAAKDQQLMDDYRN